MEKTIEEKIEEHAEIVKTRKIVISLQSGGVIELVPNPNGTGSYFCESRIVKSVKSLRKDGIVCTAVFSPESEKG